MTGRIHVRLYINEVDSLIGIIDAFLKEKNKMSMFNHEYSTIMNKYNLIESDLHSIKQRMIMYRSRILFHPLSVSEIEKGVVS